MAVYTHVSSEALSDFLADYDAGTLVSAKGIAEGVENSNYLVETSAGRYILTLYERRVEARDLPYFLSLTRHLSEAGLPVPAPIPDSGGKTLKRLAGRPACLIEFLPGVSIGAPTPALAAETGGALGQLHAAAANYEATRENTLSLGGWRELAEDIAPRLHEIDASLPALVAEEIAHLGERWPASLPRGTIHADLFPDNVLTLGGKVSGIIDFYFACTDSLAYDLAVTHAAWCFDDEGAPLRREVGEALVGSYEEVRRLTEAERQAFPLLCRGASLRFLLTRAYDWLNMPAGALVTRKDPVAFARRLAHYRAL